MHYEVRLVHVDLSPAALCFLRFATPLGYSGGKGREQVHMYRPHPVVGLHVPAGHDVLVLLKPLCQKPLCTLSEACKNDESRLRQPPETIHLGDVLGLWEPPVKIWFGENRGALSSPLVAKSLRNL